MEPVAPSLPVPLSLACCGIGLLLVAVEIWRLRSREVAFLLLAMWLRYSAAAFHEVTYRPALLGLSFIALTSVAVVAVGLIVIDRRKLLLHRLMPIYALMAIILVSAIANSAWVGLVNEIIKWCYLVVLALAAYGAMERHGSDRVLRAVLFTFAGPIAAQWVSIAMGLQVANEDGTPSFIGGYGHEQAFSIILLTFLVVNCLATKLGTTSAFLRLAVAAIGLVLANYRTTLLAAAVPAASFAVSKLMRLFVRNQRTVALVFLCAMTAVAFIGVAHLAADRFADIGTTLHKGASLIQPPQYFTREEKRIFSGRMYLWSQYIDAYMDGMVIEKLIGFGPDSWVGRFPLYAHNTFISNLYELGILGFVAFVWILAANCLAAAQAREGKVVVLACHIGFVVLNLATMPIWTLEGDILYALLLAHTWYLAPRVPVPAARYRGLARRLDTARLSTFTLGPSNVPTRGTHR